MEQERRSKLCLLEGRLRVVDPQLQATLCDVLSALLTLAVEGAEVAHAGPRHFEQRAVHQEVRRVGLLGHLALVLPCDLLLLLEVKLGFHAREERRDLRISLMCICPVRREPDEVSATGMATGLHTEINA